MDRSNQQITYVIHYIIAMKRLVIQYLEFWTVYRFIYHYSGIYGVISI
jgi:hypothetical protein